MDSGKRCSKADRTGTEYPRPLQWGNLRSCEIRDP